MTRVTNQPRPEQVAELTRGVELPLAPLPEWAMHILAEGIERAWRELLLRCAKTLRTGSEVEVTTLMESRLKSLIGEDPFWATLVSSVDRGIETMNFDGSRLELRPDLSILLTRHDARFRLVVECKLIDRPSGKTVELYCAKGLMRFLTGEYAWATREAFMLAYVRDGASIADCLVPFLDKCRNSSPDPYRTECLPAPLGHTPANVACSRHGRGFSYSHQAPDVVPGCVTIWHVWLLVSG